MSSKASTIKLKDIIYHLDFISRTRLWVEDDDEEPAFMGVVFDIPWPYLDMYLDSDINGEAISCTMINGEAYLDIALSESPRVSLDNINQN